MNRPEAVNRDPQSYLESLEPIGLSLGLDRMGALLAQLGQPQLRYRTVHVVGTNGKTSVTRTVEALLGAAGVAAGTCVSPHLRSWAERTTVGGSPLAPGPFATAVATVAAAAQRVERQIEAGRIAGIEPGERLTQFEVATAVSLLALAAARVEVAIVEAGLGGRLDATNVLDSELTVLTSVGLDHTEWLGQTETEIAAEKLAVLKPGTALLTGPLSRAAEQEAGRAQERAGAGRLSPRPEAELPPGRSGFQRRNLAVAVAAADAVLGRRISPAEIDTALAGLRLAGRFEQHGSDPEILLDVAHNPAAAAALAEMLLGSGPVPTVACVALLADKDAEGFARSLAPALSEVICTGLPEASLRASGRPGASPQDPDHLARCFGEAGLRARVVADPEAAVSATISAAAQSGARALICGSHYLVATACEHGLCDD